MSTTVADLLIKLSVQTAEMQKGLQKAESAISGFVSTAKKLFGGLAVATTLWKVNAAIKGVIDSAAEMSKISEMVGISMDKFAGLAEAADQMGVSVESLAKATKFLSKNMVEAAQGTGDVRAVFESLNVAFEKMPGVIADTDQVFLQLAERFSAMEDGAGKTAIALKFFGRSGLEMIPVLNKGRGAMEEWIAQGRRMGSVMTAEMGRDAREFKMSLEDINDGIGGVTKAFTAALLPVLKGAAKGLAQFTEDVNGVRVAMKQLVELMVQGFLFTGITLLAKLVVVMRAFVIASPGFILAINGILATITGWMVANPVLATTMLLIAATYQLILVYKDLTTEVDKSDEEFKNLVTSMKELSFDEQRIRIDVYTQAISDMRREIFALRQNIQAKLAFGDKIGAVEDQKKIDDMAAKIKVLTFELGLLRQEHNKKTPAKLYADPNVVDALKKKLVELNATFAQLGPPAEAMRKAFKAQIDIIIEGKGPIELYKKQVDALIAKYNEWLAKDAGQKKHVATQKGLLDLELAIWDNFLSQLDIDYARGLVDINQYYDERIRAITVKTRAEIAALQEEQGRGTTAPERKVAIDFEIEVKGGKLQDALAKEKEAARLAINALKETLRAGELQSAIDANNIDLEIITAQYEQGLLDLKSFYDKRRQIETEENSKRIESLKASIFEGMDPGAREKALNEIASLEKRNTLTTMQLNRQQAAESKKLALEAVDVAKMLLEVKVDQAGGGLDRMRLENQIALTEMDQRSQAEIEKMNEFLGKKTDAEMSFNDKRQAMEDLYAEQSKRRAQTLVNQEIAIMAQKLMYAQQITSGLSQMFGDLYALSGEKIKAFFYIQKAVAVAEATIAGTLAYLNALSMKPTWLGMAMAATIAGMTAAKIAMIVATTIKGAAKGGHVTDGSGTKDDVLVRVMKGEYILPKGVVSYYGLNMMEALRRKLIPKGVFSGLPFFPVMSPGLAFATGGNVSGTGIEGGMTNAVTVPVNVYGGDKGLAPKLRAVIEDVVIKTLREYTR